MEQKVALYCRLSKEDTSTGESESIQNQKLLLAAYAKEQNWSIASIYCDEDYSGLDDSRPDFCRMLTDAQQGKFSIILCKTQSRFTRNMATAEKYLHTLFPLWQIRFVTIVDQVDTASKANKKARQINSLINEWYCEELSENIRKVFRKKQEQGQFLGNYAPYGYQKSPQDRHCLLPDDTTAPVVVWIYQQYATGAYSCAAIAKVLTQRCIPTPAQYKAAQGKDMGRAGIKYPGVWAETTIRRILKNPVYIGTMVQGKEKKCTYKSSKTKPVPPHQWVVVSHTHPPLLPEALFYRCQTIRVQKKSSSNSCYKEN